MYFLKVNWNLVDPQKIFLMMKWRCKWRESLYRVVNCRFMLHDYFFLSLPIWNQFWPKKVREGEKDRDKTENCW